MEDVKKTGMLLTAAMEENVTNVNAGLMLDENRRVKKPKI